MNNPHFIQLSDILFELAENEDDINKAKEIYKKVLLLDEHLNATEKVYSLERYMRIGKIKSLLEST